MDRKDRVAYMGEEVKEDYLRHPGFDNNIGHFKEETDGMTMVLVMVLVLAMELAVVLVMLDNPINSEDEGV